jgi:hypothetical protein
MDGGWMERDGVVDRWMDAKGKEGGAERMRGGMGGWELSAPLV